MYAIAIDGPAGAGKSSIAKAAAKRLGFIYVDTGALYRTVALHLIKENIDPKDIEAVKGALPNIQVTMGHEEDGQHVYLCGEDVTGLIRTPEVSMMASTSSAIPEVRKFLFSLQTGMAEKYNVIMDGRDIGTVVLPNAQVKVFLTASPEVRAMRRYKELVEKGTEDTYEEVLADMEARDKNDRERESAPCVPADDAVLFVNDGYTVETSAEYIIELAKNKVAELQ